MRKGMMCKLLLHIMTYLFFLPACDRDVHESEYVSPPEQGLLVVGTTTDVPVSPVEKVNLLLFGEDDRLALWQSFAEARQLSLRSFPLAPGYYTIIVVAGVERNAFAPQAKVGKDGTLLADFIDRLPDIENAYPGMLAGNVQTVVSEGHVTHETVTLRTGAAGIVLPTLHVRFSLPEPTLPPYEPRHVRTTKTGHVLRCVAEVCQTGTDEVVYRKTVIPEQQAFDLRLNAGSYDLRLWMDYVPSGTISDASYLTSNGLTAVSISHKPYTANTDSKDAAYVFCQDATLNAKGDTLDVRPERPLAKFRLVATDVERYRRQVEENGYPSLENLKVNISYEGYFPSGFNVVTGKPNNAIGGVGYEHALPPVSHRDNETTVTSDWIFVNGTESFVRADILISDKQGTPVSRIDGVRIDYHRGYLTTVRGDFLTAGTNGGGIHVDTSWEGEYEVEF